MGTKKIGTLKMAFTFAGCFLGAGYVSGQELWQYFGSYGPVGILGLILAILLLIFVSVTVMDLSIRTGKVTMPDLIVRWDIPWLKRLFGIFEVFLFFSIGSIMIAGIGNLFTSLLGVPTWAACLLVTLFTAAAAYFGLEGMVAVFSSTSPVLVVTALVICLIKIAGTGTEAFRLTAGSTNPMLGPWWFSSVNYTALNIFGSIALLSPLASVVKDGTKGITKGCVIGGVSLFAVAICIVFALNSYPACVTEELPMLAVAKNVGEAAAWIYAGLIFLAMFGIALSSLVAVSSHLEYKFTKVKEHKFTEFVILALATFGASLIGFSGLISYVYPVFGYVGIVSILGVLDQAVYVRLKNGKKNMAGDRSSEDQR